MSYDTSISRLLLLVLLGEMKQTVVEAASAAGRLLPQLPVVGSAAAAADGQPPSGASCDTIV